jgi:hypothetical protein
MTARRSGIRLTWSVAALVTVNLAAQGTGGIAAASDDWGNSPGRSVLVADAAPGYSVLQEGEERIAVPLADDPTSLIAPASDIDSNITAWHATASCVTEACECDECRAGRRCGDGHRCRLVDCDPPGLFQRLAALHDKSGACWTGRVDAIIMWRNAPRYRPLFTTFDPVALTPGPVALNADGLESDALAAPRLTLLRTDSCGNGIELGYLYAGNFYSRRSLPEVRDGYATAAPGLYGNTWGPAATPLNSASATLLANLQTAEINHRTSVFGGMGQFLAGFRWLQWNEQLQMTDTFSSPAPPAPVTDAGVDGYSTRCFNNLFGGQIGLDAKLLQIKRLRLDGLVKAGAYYNAASQQSLYGYMSDGAGGPFAFSTGFSNSSPAACSFVGEVGLTAAIPLRDNLDFRFGYFGLWVDGLAQPTNQLSTQTLTQFDPPSGKLDTTGGVILQGVSLGLEGRW